VRRTHARPSVGYHTVHHGNSPQFRKRRSSGHHQHTERNAVTLVKANAGGGRSPMRRSPTRPPTPSNDECCGAVRHVVAPQFHLVVQVAERDRGVPVVVRSGIWSPAATLPTCFHVPCTVQNTSKRRRPSRRSSCSENRRSVASQQHTGHGLRTWRRRPSRPLMYISTLYKWRFMACSVLTRIRQRSSERRYVSPQSGSHHRNGR
jgi:hypothetical protein